MKTLQLARALTEFAAAYGDLDIGLLLSPSHGGTQVEIINSIKINDLTGQAVLHVAPSKETAEAISTAVYEALVLRMGVT